MENKTNKTIHTGQPESEFNISMKGLGEKLKQIISSTEDKHERKLVYIDVLVESVELAKITGEWDEVALLENTLRDTINGELRLLEDKQKLIENRKLSLLIKKNIYFN
jgi:uncharacterized protein YjcR